MQTNTAQELDDLDKSMRSAHLIPLWQLESEIMGVTPAPKTQAWMWRWEELYSIAERAGELVPVERGGDRRAIALANPGLDGLPYATATLWAAVQWLNGREVAPAHRHTSQAIRLIIDGAGSYSTVEGDKVFLERGDLVLTPPWLWHDHGSESDERAVWMDALDIPLTNYADASFFEPYGAERATPSGRPHRADRSGRPQPPQPQPADHRPGLATADRLGLDDRPRRRPQPRPVLVLRRLLVRPIKLIHAELIHKTEAGAVHLGLATPNDAAAALGKLRRVAAPAGSRYLVEEMAPGGPELLLATMRDPTFGPLVVLGAGGVDTESLGDVTMRLAPTLRVEAESMLPDLLTRARFLGHCGAPAVDRAELVEKIIALGDLLASEPALEEIEINPLRVSAAGLPALDALVKPRGSVS